MHKTIAVTIGLMLYWPMLRGPYFQNLFFTPSPTGLDGREAYAITNILIVGLAALALRKASQFPYCAIRSARPSSSLLAGFACAIAAALLFSSSQLTSTFTLAMQLAGIVSFAIGFSAITLGWFSHLLSSHENWVFIASVSFAASFASASIEYLPDSAVKASLVMLPLASSALLALANCVAKQPEKSAPPSFRQQYSPHANIIVLAATCFCLIASTPTLCLFAPTTGYMPTLETPKSYLFSFLIAIAMAGIMKLHKPFPIKQGIILVILGELLILSSLALALTDNAMPFAATTHTCLQFSLFISLLSFWAEKRGGELGGAGTFLAITSLTAIASRYLLPIAFPRESPEPIAAILGMLSIVILSAAGMCLALFAMMHLSSFKDRMPVADDESSRKKGNLSSVVNAEASAVPSDSPTQSAAQNSDDALRTWLAGGFFLSPRETDIALLVARGYTVNRIAEELCLARGTVQSHTKSIYRKLNVHSKQEVIDLVQSQSSL